MAFFDLSLKELQAYCPDREEPADFDAFWKSTLEEARELPLHAAFEKVDYGLVAQETFDVTFSGFGGQPVKGWLILPSRRTGRLPCVVEYIGYGGGRGFATDWLLWASAGYAHLVMDTRGQGSSWSSGDTPDLYADGGNAHYPGSMTKGILDPRHYYYRRVFTDAVRAIEAARSHPEVEASERLARLEALPFKGWPCNTLGNHDSSRIHTRYGDRFHDAELARLHAALVLTLKGTPFLYNGEEIGMTDHIIADPSRLRDTMATWYYDRLVNELNVPADEAAQRAGEMSRDKNRTPMQWSNDPNAGFSPANVETWLPVNPDYKRGINVRDQEHNPNSLLNYYRLLLGVRKQNPALIEGGYLPVHETSEEYYAFLRSSEMQTVLVVLNFSGQPLELDLSDVSEIRGHDLRILFSSAERLLTTKPPRGLSVSPFEVFIAEVQP